MSGFSSAIASITDPYDRQARLWPALLALLPLIVAIGTVYGPRVSAVTNVVTLAIACGGLYLLAQISRDRGKALEVKLYVEWGGKPTTQLLRHRNETLEAATKLRYHALLSRKIDQALPDANQEATDPRASDDMYQTAIRWLLNHTRDTTRFDLLFKENISYGFRRNALGMKTFALLLASACLIFIAIKYGLINASGWNGEALSTLPDEVTISAMVSLLALGVWTFFITKQAAKTAAFTYAETLLRACDVIE